ncbi:IS3 family transposase, partial [Adlercreutzia caecimuris]|uniref:IS3 family transposase n=1 Tax=Adlercreutzia caecimuris TaxID=671266 RepID=UPI0025B194D2
MLDKLNLPRTTYYRYAGGRNPRADRWADVRPLVREAFSRTPNGMGYRQVAMILEAEQGLSISGKTALKLMREEGLRCRIRRKRYDSYRGERGRVAGNILDRDFGAEAPMAKLVTDVTEFKVAGGKAYLSPVMDLYNNEIVAWSVSRSPNMAQAMEMLDRLEPLLRGPALLHSDQGWQYQQLSFQRRLERMGLVQSMSRKATCLDNACMEGFFGHLKDEFYRHRAFDSFDSFKEQIDAYIAYW